MDICVVAMLLYMLACFIWLELVEMRLTSQKSTIDRLNQRVAELEAFNKSLVMPSIQGMYTVSCNLPEGFIDPAWWEASKQENEPAIDTVTTSPDL